MGMEDRTRGGPRRELAGRREVSGPGSGTRGRSRRAPPAHDRRRAAPARTRRRRRSSNPARAARPCAPTAPTCRAPRRRHAAFPSPPRLAAAAAEAAVATEGRARIDTDGLGATTRGARTIADPPADLRPPMARTAPPEIPIPDTRRTDEVVQLSLVEAVHAALEHNPGIAAQRLTPLRQLEDVNLAEANFDPKFLASLEQGLPRRRRTRRRSPAYARTSRRTATANSGAHEAVPHRRRLPHRLHQQSLRVERTLPGSSAAVPPGARLLAEPAAAAELRLELRVPAGRTSPRSTPRARATRTARSSRTS